MSTRQKLIETARQLFAERGVYDVSLREISRAAGQRNVSALQYHFGDRDRLLRAILEPYERQIEVQRAALLDEIDRRNEATVRDLAGAIIRPLASLLAEPGGREALRIMAEQIAGAEIRPAGEATYDAVTERWRQRAERWMPPEGARLHRRFTALQLATHELGRRAVRPTTEHRLFISHLVDLTAAILTAPLSEETASLLAHRDGD